MQHHGYSSAFSRLFRFLSNDPRNRRARRAMRRSRTYSRPVLECLESRVLLSSYIVDDLGTLGGTTSEAYAINAKGEVVGEAYLANGNHHAAVWEPGKPAQDLGTLGGANSAALAINILGEIVGRTDTASANDHPFDLQPGKSMTDLTNAPPQSSFGDSLLTANGVSDTGMIVGRGVFNLIDLTVQASYAYDPPSGTLNMLNGLNLGSDFNLDQITSGETAAVAGTRAVANLVYLDHGNDIQLAAVEDINTPNSEVPLPAIANQTSSTVYSISTPNSSGTQFAAGEAIDSSGKDHAVLWTIPTNPHSATVSDLGTLSGASPDLVYYKAIGVNAEGDVVGEVDSNDVVNGKNVAFIKYHDGTMTPLNSLLPSNSGVWVEFATGINDSGQICAIGITTDGQVHGFRLTPVATAPPQVTLTDAPDVNSSGGTTYSLVVTYSDDIGIDTSTLANAIQVTGPAGFSQTATLQSTSGTPNQLAATYTITPPGGTWDFTDNGTYNLTLKNNVVKDSSGQPLAGGTLGHFVAAINVQRGSISGTVYNDANANGKRDPGEGGVPNTDVFLDLNGDGTFDLGDRITQTDANGAYSFQGLLPGAYRVREYVNLPHAVTSPSNDLYTVNLSEGQNATGLDFGDVADPQITGIAGQNLVNAHGKTAQFDQSATVLHVTGVNFDASDVFYFGNDQASTGLRNLQTGSNGVQTFDLQVSQYATTGPLVVYSPGANRYTTLLPTFTVDSYRNVNGYSFGNPGESKDFSFDELTKVYGSDQTDISVLGYDTGIPNPLAYLELAIINSVLPPSNGLCLGYSLSSARLSLGLGPYSISDFQQTTSGTPFTVWDMASPSGPSPDLNNIIRLAHLEQTSAEVLHHYVAQVAADEINGVSNLINDVKSELAQGRPVPIGMLLPDGGHAVLAYNVENGPNGSYTLDIYDPDLPFQTNEDNAVTSAAVPGVEDGTLHKNEVDGSTITFGSDGHWVYNGGAGHGSGGLGSIAPIPLSTFDSHTLVASLSGLLTVLIGFGSAAETQVTDSSGHTLLKADGSPNTNPTTMIPNAARYDLSDPGSTPLDLVQGTGNFLQTLTGTGSGAYGAASLGKDAMATISGISTTKGQADQFGLDPAGNKLTFAPGVAKNLNADLMVNAADGTVYEAQVSSKAVGGTQTLQFQSGQVEFQNASGGDTNPTESISLNFGHVNPAALMTQTFSTGRITLAAGDKVDVLPSDWNDLQDATAQVTIHHKDGTTTTSTISNQSSGGVLNMKEGVSFNGPVAAFANVSSTGLSASIDWGDGTTSTGTVGVAGTGALVGGTHTYAHQGYYTVRTTLSDANGQLGQATSEAVVSDASFSLSSANVSAFAGVPFSGKVATLTDASPGDTAGDFDVKINWGDGTTSAGTLQETAAGKFDVRGSHTWATTGNKSILVTVTEHGSASGQGQTLTIGSNTNFSGTIAQLQLPIPGSDTSDYTATIDWGDGTNSTGTLTRQSDGSVILSGSHTYATGNRSYVTHFALTGGPSASTTSSAAVSLAVGTVTGTLYADINGNGKQDTGDQGIPGQIVYIDVNHNGKLDSGEPSAVTNSAGVYTIANAPAGNIQVSEVVPSGFRVSAPASGSYTVTLNAGQTLSKLDLANTQLAQISGTVFIDANSNGKQDASEPGRANQIVYLDLNNDGVLQPTEPVALTDSTGAFAFTVNPGTYVVRLEPFSDFTITTPSSGSYSVAVAAGSADSSSLFGEHLVTHSPPPPPPPPPPPGGGGSPSPSPAPPPTLHTPPLLALIDAILGGIETINSNHTETVTDSIFGFPLFVSTYDGAGNLTSVTYFGINITFLFA